MQKPHRLKKWWAAIAPGLAGPVYWIGHGQWALLIAALALAVLVPLGMLGFSWLKSDPAMEERSKREIVFRRLRGLPDDDQ